MEKQLPESQLAQKVITTLASVGESFKQAASIKSLSAFASAIGTVIVVVENFSTEIKASTENKQDVAVSVLNYFIDVPFLPEYFEDKVLRFAIDTLIAFLNEKFGNQWLGKISPK